MLPLPRAVPARPRSRAPGRGPEGDRPPPDPSNRPAPPAVSMTPSLPSARSPSSPSWPTPPPVTERSTRSTRCGVTRGSERRATTMPLQVVGDESTGQSQPPPAPPLTAVLIRAFRPSRASILQTLLLNFAFRDEKQPGWHVPAIFGRDSFTGHPSGQGLCTISVRAEVADPAIAANCKLLPTPPDQGSTLRFVHSRHARDAQRGRDHEDQS